VVSMLEALARAPPLLLWLDLGWHLGKELRPSSRWRCRTNSKRMVNLWKITSLDLARTLKANTLMLVGRGEGFIVMPRP
jgi:hypothetical protein